MKVGRETKTVANEVVQGECAINGVMSKEELWLPDDEGGWDVDCILTACAS